MLSDDELGRVIVAAAEIDDCYGGIVERLALTGQRCEEVTKPAWQEIDIARRLWTIAQSRTKNAKAHVVHLSDQSIAVLDRMKGKDRDVFVFGGAKPFQDFARAKRKLDELSRVTG